MCKFFLISYLKQRLFFLSCKKIVYVNVSVKQFKKKKVFVMKDPKFLKPRKQSLPHLEVKLGL